MSTKVRFHCTQTRTHGRVAKFLRIKSLKDQGIWEGTRATTPSSNTATHRSYTAFYDMCEQRIYAVLDWASGKAGTRRAPRRPTRGVGKATGSRDSEDPRDPSQQI